LKGNAKGEIIMSEERHEYFDSHYANEPIQPIELMQDILTHDEFVGFLKGNMLKYSMRAGHKQGEPAEKDATKYKRYAEWLAMAVKGERIDPRL
jgi:hypothetical protein